MKVFIYSEVFVVLLICIHPIYVVYYFQSVFTNPDGNVY